MKIMVPDAFYKIIGWTRSNKKIKIICYLIPNDKTNKSLSNFKIKLKKILKLIDYNINYLG